MTKRTPPPAIDHQQFLATAATAATPTDHYLTHDDPANIDPQTQRPRGYSVVLLQGVLFQPQRDKKGQENVAGEGSFVGPVRVFEEASPQDSQNPQRVVVKRSKDHRDQKTATAILFSKVDSSLQAKNEVEIYQKSYPHLAAFSHYFVLPNKTWRSTLPYFPGRVLIYELVNLVICYSETNDKIFLNRIIYWFFLMLQEMLRIKQIGIVHQDAHAGNFIPVQRAAEYVVQSIDYGFSRIQETKGVWDLPRLIKQNMPFIAPELRDIKLIPAKFDQDVYSSARLMYDNDIGKKFEHFNWSPYFSEFVDELSHQYDRRDLRDALKMALDHNPNNRLLMEALYVCLAYEFILMDEEFGDKAQSASDKKKWYERALATLHKTLATLVDMQTLWQTHLFSSELIQRKCGELQTKAIELEAKLVALPADLEDEKHLSVLYVRKPKTKLKNIIPKLVLNAHEPGREEMYAYASVPPQANAPAAASPNDFSGEAKKLVRIATRKPVNYYLQKLASIITKDSQYEDYDAFCGNGPSLELGEFHATLALAQYRGDYVTYQRVVLTHYASNSISCETAYQLMRLVPVSQRKQQLVHGGDFDLVALRRKFFEATGAEVDALYRNGKISYQTAREWMTRDNLPLLKLTPKVIQGMLEKNKISLKYSVQLLNEIAVYTDPHLQSAYTFYQQTVLQQSHAKKISYPQTYALMREVPMRFRLKDPTLNKFFIPDQKGIQQRYQQGEISLTESLSTLALLNSWQGVEQDDKKVDAKILKDALLQYDQQRGWGRKYLGWVCGVSKTKTIEDLETLLAWSHGSPISSNVFEFVLRLSDARQPVTRKASVYQNSRVQLFKDSAAQNNHAQKLTATERAIDFVGRAPAG